MRALIGRSMAELEVGHLVRKLVWLVVGVYNAVR